LDELHRLQKRLVKINRNKDNASDAAPLGPRSAVTDLLALEGTTVDDPAMSLELHFKIMVPLVGDRVACPVCEKRKFHLFFMTLTDLDRRLDQHHTDAHIEWWCIYCEISST
jgi:hypothetical protein